MKKEKKLKNFTLNDEVYNRLRGLIELGLPALSVFYLTLAELWGLPAAQPVAGSLAALVVLASVFLRLARSNYEPPTDGEIVVEENANDSGQVLASLDNVSVDDLLHKGHITLSVNKLGGTSQD